MKRLISLFRSHLLEMFGTLLRQELIGNGFHKEESQVTLTFVRNGYVLEGFVLSLEHYNEGGCLIMEPKVWPCKVQRVYGDRVWPKPEFEG